MKLGILILLVVVGVLSCAGRECPCWEPVITFAPHDGGAD